MCAYKPPGGIKIGNTKRIADIIMSYADFLNWNFSIKPISCPESKTVSRE